MRMFKCYKQLAAFNKIGLYETPIQVINKALNRPCPNVLSRIEVINLNMEYLKEIFERGNLEEMYLFDEKIDGYPIEVFWDLKERVKWVHYIRITSLQHYEEFPYKNRRWRIAYTNKNRVLREFLKKVDKFIEEADEKLDEFVLFN